MAKSAKDDETVVPIARYQGRPITKRVVNLGIGGEIDLPADLINAEPRARIRFTAEADLGAVKHKFEANGNVTEATILTVDRESFVVTDVAEPEPIPEQATLGETEGTD